MNDIDSLKLALRKFSDARDWAQFHSPKNLAAALTVEAAELLEHFQWMTEQQSRELAPDKLAKVAEELADVLLYLVQIADKLDVDLIKVSLEKLAKNADRYPVPQSRGSSRKYTEITPGSKEE